MLVSYLQSIILETKNEQATKQTSKQLGENKKSRQMTFILVIKMTHVSLFNEDSSSKKSDCWTYFKCLELRKQCHPDKASHYNYAKFCNVFQFVYTAGVFSLSLAWRLEKTI